MTSFPFLKIARDFGIPYEDVLLIINPSMFRWKMTFLYGKKWLSIVPANIECWMPLQMPDKKKTTQEDSK